MFGGTIRLNPLGICIILALSILFFLSVNTNILRSNESIKNESGRLTNTVSLKKLLTDCVQVAEKGGKEVVRIRKDPDIGEKSKGSTKEGANDIYTKADYESHCIMYHSLKQAYPAVKIISEEQQAKECKSVPLLDKSIILGDDNFDDENIAVSDITVWIDPLDATMEYTENLLNYVTTMVCVAVKGKPILGIIHKPFEENSPTFWAWVDKIASSNIKASISPVKEHKPKKIIVSRSHTGKNMNATLGALSKEADVILAGGAGYKSLEVAFGNADAYIHITDIKKWDICAGNAIINALGGKMTTLSNAVIDYSSDSPVKNSDGLLATLTQHEWFLGKLKFGKE